MSINYHTVEVRKAQSGVFIHLNAYLVIDWNNTVVYYKKIGEILMLIPAKKKVHKARFDNIHTNDL